MTRSDIKRLTTLHKELKDIFDEYGPIGYIKELIDRVTHLGHFLGSCLNQENAL